eukprot:m.1006833 g.1006833  ORF g.1006833 m.1006833 type:complete len:60 (+) comp24056_c1_seq17:705-884(+)
MPTTISSGIILTQQANGNYALAVLLTVTTYFVPFDLETVCVRVLHSVERAALTVYFLWL